MYILRDKAQDFPCSICGSWNADDGRAYYMMDRYVGRLTFCSLCLYEFYIKLRDIFDCVPAEPADIQYIPPRIFHLLNAGKTMDAVRELRNTTNLSVQEVGKQLGKWRRQIAAWQHRLNENNF